MNNLSDSQQGFDGSILYLGSLCGRGHDWRGTGKSLRYIKCSSCVVCRGVARPGAGHKAGRCYPPIEARFWKNVDRKAPDECWTWRGTKMSGGYGHVRCQGKRDKAHRMSYLLHFGGIPEGLYVLHKCDNPPCVNPNHLFLGTHEDNMADREAKGRNKIKYGEDHKNAKLTESDVKQIRTLYATGSYTYTDLGRMFNVSRDACFRIVKRVNWKHVF